MSEIKTEFDAAIATARHALEQFSAEPPVAASLFAMQHALLPEEGFPTNLAA